MALAETIVGAAVRAIRNETADDLRARIDEIEQRIAALRARSAARIREAEGADDFESAAAIRKDVERIEWEARRDEARLAELRHRLADALAREQAEALRRHRKIVLDATAKLRKAVVAAAAAQGDVIRLREAAKVAIGAALAEREIPLSIYRGLLLPDLVSAWERELDQLTAPRAPGRAPPPGIAYYQGQTNSVSAQPSAAPASRRATGRVGENVAISTPSALTVTALAPAGLAKRLPDDDRPLEAGNVRARVVREGYTDQAGAYCAAGRKIQLPRATAEAAARHGAVEILPETEVTK